MSLPVSRLRSHLTLFLAAILHAFTHAYASMLVPLYVLMTANLHLRGVKQATMIVSVYSLVYCLNSYFAGVIADRVNRKVLLSIGLLGNAVAIVLMGLTSRYELLLALAVMAGLCGTLFHPAAAALVPAHYPKSPGMAVGLLGMGAGLGFFVGPQYAGWRAQTATWSLWHVEHWQKPCIEMGLAGLAMGILFICFGAEAAGQRHISQRLGRRLSGRVAATAVLLSGRDFAGVAGLSLASIYLQKAHHFDPRQTGLVVGSMMLLSMLVNPLLVWISGGRRRLRWLSGVLLIGGVVCTVVPFFPAALALPVLCGFQTCQMGSYAISDAAILERVPAHSRGRVYGLFLSIAGTASAIGPWLMGMWTDAMKENAGLPLAYLPLFASLGGLMALSLLAGPVIRRLGEVTSVVDPISETMPGTMEVVG